MLRLPGEAVNVSGSGSDMPERPKTQVSGRPSPTGAGSAADGEPAVGATLDDFLLVDELGEGAFAKVFLAHQQSLHRTVALKVFTDPSREAQTLAQVDHPNIVRVHDQRTVPGQDLQLLYMEYVPGGTLEDVVARAAAAAPEQRSGRLVLEAIDENLGKRGESPPLDSRLRSRLEASNWPEAIALLGAHMAVALDFAHSRGVLHRDMKPANVLLDGTGRAKLADFNISSASGLEDDDEEAVGGTLPYMAPEQVRAVSPWHEGGAADLDERTDIYGLGVVLWELLTGDLPFPDPKDGAGMQEVIEHLESTRSAGIADAERARADAAGFPLLVDTLAACLAPDPAERPQSGAELRRRLEWCLDPQLRTLLDAPPKGVCAWLCRIPLIAMIAAVAIPNIVLSVSNVLFNVNVNVEEAKRGEFMDVVGLVNGIAFPVGIAIFAVVGWALRSVVRARVRNEATGEEQRVVARRRGLRLGATMAAVILPLWILGGIVFPLWQQQTDTTMSAAARTQAWHNFTVSNTLFGLIAATLSFFLIHTIVARLLLPRLIAPGDVDPDNAAHIDRILGRLGWFFAASTFVPFASVILLAAGPNSMKDMAPAFITLGVMGTLAFAATYRMQGRIRRNLEALGRALAAPQDRFRAPI